MIKGAWICLIFITVPNMFIFGPSVQNSIAHLKVTGSETLFED